MEKRGGRGGGGATLSDIIWKGKKEISGTRLHDGASRSLYDMCKGIVRRIEKIKVPRRKGNLCKGQKTCLHEGRGTDSRIGA